MLFCFKFLLKRLFSWEIGRFNFIWKWPNLIWAFHPILVTSFFGCFWQRSYQYITFVCFLFCLTHFGLKTENIVQKITQPKWWKTKNEVTKICDEPGNIVHIFNLVSPSKQYAEALRFFFHGKLLLCKGDLTRVSEVFNLADADMRCKMLPHQPFYPFGEQQSNAMVQSKLSWFLFCIKMPPHLEF